jgi:hypothetical protein
MAFPLRKFFDLHHILNRDAFGDADYECNAGVGSFQDSISSKSRWYENDGNISPGLFYAVGYCIETLLSRWVVPPLPGVTPPTTLVPYSIICEA